MAWLIHINNNQFMEIVFYGSHENTRFINLQLNVTLSNEKITYVTGGE